jgi:hypothetical protein
VGDYLPDIAVDPNSGALYVTWADGLGGATNKIVLSRSTDGGQHWSAPTVVSHHDSAQSFNDAVAVANDGELRELRGHVPAAAALGTVPAAVRADETRQRSISQLRRSQRALAGRLASDAHGHGRGAERMLAPACAHTAINPRSECP